MEAPKRARMPREHNPPHAQGAAPGSAVDASGNPVLDPTANVLALVAAANRRQDDLGALNEVLTLERIKRVEDLQIKDFAHSMAMLNLSATHAKDIAAIHDKHGITLHAIISKDIEAMTARLGPLEKAVFESAAKGAGLSAAWGYLIGFAGLAATLIMVGLFVFQNGRTATTPAPQYYAPAAPGTLVPSQQQQAPQR